MKSNSTLKVPTTVFLNNAFTKTTSWIWGCMLLTVLLFSGVSFGQTVANYTFSESAGTYTAITGTTAIAAGWDDNVTGNTIPIGFTFNYAETTIQLVLLTQMDL
jgi:hypothetical protein